MATAASPLGTGRGRWRQVSAALAGDFRRCGVRCSTMLPGSSKSDGPPLTLSSADAACLLQEHRFQEALVPWPLIRSPRCNVRSQGVLWPCLQCSPGGAPLSKWPWVSLWHVHRCSEVQRRPVQKQYRRQHKLVLPFWERFTLVCTSTSAHGPYPGIASGPRHSAAERHVSVGHKALKRSQPMKF